jgi:manganese oxidase
MWLDKRVTVLILLIIAMSTSLAEVRQVEMTIEEVEIEVAPGFKTKVWGFNGQVPGPLIHVKEGDQVEVTVHNLTGLSHTIHWHGVFQTNSWRSDGVPHVTQHGIEPGESFTYRFIADKVGSLWYHCHVNVNEHVGIRGMWGPLIVEPKDPTPLEQKVTHDAILMFSGWSEKYADSYGNGPRPGDVLNFYSINGKSFPMTQPIRVREGDVLRMRLYAATIPVAFHLHGHDMIVTHKDGKPLEQPYEADVVGMQPGERYDVIVHMNNPGLWMTHDHIDHHTTNNGREHGGSMLVVEYEEIEPADWYDWKDIEFQPDFYMIESMRKPHGLHSIPVHQGRDLM